MTRTLRPKHSAELAKVVLRLHKRGHRVSVTYRRDHVVLEAA